MRQARPELSPLKAFTPLSLGKWAEGVGNSSDVTVVFKRPTQACIIGISVLSGAMTIFIDFAPGVMDNGVSKVQVGIHDGPPASEPPPPSGTIGNGTCGATQYGLDCNTAPRGAWNAKTENITDLAACVAKG